MPDSVDERHGLLSFLSEYVRSPGAVGAIAPSSAALARVATAPVPTAGDTVVVKLGAGTGAFTERIQQRPGGRGRHIAIERYEWLAIRLTTRHDSGQVNALRRAVAYTRAAFGELLGEGTAQAPVAPVTSATAHSIGRPRRVPCGSARPPSVPA